MYWSQTLNTSLCSSPHLGLFTNLPDDSHGQAGLRLTGLTDVTLTLYIYSLPSQFVLPFFFSFSRELKGDWERDLGSTTLYSLHYTVCQAQTQIRQYPCLCSCALTWQCQWEVFLASHLCPGQGATSSIKSQKSGCLLLKQDFNGWHSMTPPSTPRLTLVTPSITGPDHHSIARPT